MNVLTLPSVLDAVTVYAQGALCTRLARLAPADGRFPDSVRIAGLPLSLLPGSLRASIVSGPPDLQVQAVRGAFDCAFGDQVDLSAERRALDEALAACTRLEGEAAAVSREIQELSKLAPIFPKPHKGEPPREAPIGALLGFGEFVESELAGLHGRLHRLEKEVRDAQNEVRLRRSRLEEASSAGKARRVQLSRVAELTLSLPAAPAEAQLSVEYLVPGARWAPSYDLKLDRAMTRGALRMRASVVQRSGEDWSGVRLGLSTADLDRRAQLPELRALRIGRAQPPPPRSGWREPPPGLDELFTDFERVARPPAEDKTARPAPRKDRAPAERRKGQSADARKQVARPRPEEADEITQAGAPRRPPAPPPMAAPAGMLADMVAAAPSMSRAGGLMKKEKRAAMEVEAEVEEVLEMDEMAGEGYGGEPEPPEPAAAPSSPAEDLLDYDRLALSGPREAGRGRLAPRDLDALQLLALSQTVHVRVDVLTALVVQHSSAAEAVSGLRLPGHAEPVRESAGSYDYRYDAAHRVDVESDGQWHVVPIAQAEVALEPEFVAVPSVDPHVFRTVRATNRSPHALLAGPVDITVGDEFLMTAPLPTLAQGGQARVGLGVEESIQVARNTRYHESNAGLMGGAQLLTHEIAVDVVNRLAGPAPIVVRERVPVPEDSDVKVEESASDPPWRKPPEDDNEVTAEGARLWKVTVAPGEKKTLTAQYVVRIPGGKMLVGGNRRA